MYRGVYPDLPNLLELSECERKERREGEVVQDETDTDMSTYSSSRL